MARRNRNMMGGIRREMAQSRSIAGMRPWRATHGWRTASPVVQGEVDTAMSELKGMSLSSAVAGMRPWRATHGWRTSPPAVQGVIDTVMASMKSGGGPRKPMGGPGTFKTGGWKRGRGLAQKVLRQKYGTGFPG